MQDTAAIGQLWQQAERQLAARNLGAAREGFERVLAADPDNVMARLRLSTLSTRQGRYRESIQHLLAVLDLQPADPFLLVMLAGMLHRLGEVRAASRCLTNPAVTSCPDSRLLLEAAQLASQLEDAGTATALLAQLESRGAIDSDALYLRATLDQFAGRMDQCEANLERCLAATPMHAPAHWALSKARRQTSESNHVARLRACLARGPDAGSSAYLRFALFKELDDLGEHEQAWSALSAGCAAKRGLLAYDAAAEAAAFDRLLQLDAASLSSSALAPVATPVPIFIVGLPRTGTTLLERILGRHPAVHDAGELDELPLQLRWLADRFSKSYLDAGVFDAVAGRDMAQLGGRYLQHAAWRAGDNAVFTDKLPLNFLHVGLIARALPQAKILHMTRDPMDACFSNLKELFNEAYPYSYSLEDIAGHYGRYRRLMAHWHAQFPGRVLDISYEALATDPLAETRRILAHCGLPWHADCVAIERSTSAVSTASSAQVREPINVKAIGAWRRYAGHLQQLRQRLQADGWIGE